MNLNGLTYLTCTLLCKYFIIIMVIYIYIHTHTHSQKFPHLLPSSKYYSQINNLKSKLVHTIELQFQTSTGHQFYTRISGPPAAHSQNTGSIPG